MGTRATKQRPTFKEGSHSKQNTNNKYIKVITKQPKNLKVVME